MASLVVDWTKELQDEGNLGDGSASVAAFDEAYYLRVSSSRLARHHFHFDFIYAITTRNVEAECLEDLLHPGTR